MQPPQARAGTRPCCPCRMMEGVVSCRAQLAGHGARVRLHSWRGPRSATVCGADQNLPGVRGRAGHVQHASTHCTRRPHALRPWRHKGAPQRCRAAQGRRLVRGTHTLWPARAPPDASAGARAAQRTSAAPSAQAASGSGAPARQASSRATSVASATPPAASAAASLPSGARVCQGACWLTPSRAHCVMVTCEGGG
jgi:hypothetical protein